MTQDKKDWLEFTTTYNLPFESSLQDEEVADLYKQWQANKANKLKSTPKVGVLNKMFNAIVPPATSQYLTEDANGKVTGKDAYDNSGKLLGQYDPESVKDASGKYDMTKVPNIIPISAERQQFRSDMKRHEQQVAAQVAKERGPMPWEKPQNKPAPSRKGTRENPYTTNTEVKGARVGEWCIHKGKPYQLRQADIDWANGKRPAATTKPATTKPATTKPATTKPATTKPAATPQMQGKQIVQLKRTNDWRTLHKLRKAGIPVVDRGDFYETDRAIYMKPKKENGRVITSINDTNARKSHFVRNRNGKGGQWVDYTPEEMAQRGKTAEDEVLAARSGTPLQTIKPNGQFVDSADDVKGNKLNPNILAGVQAGELGRG